MTGEKGKSPGARASLPARAQLSALFTSISGGFALLDQELRLGRASPVLRALGSTGSFADDLMPLARSVLDTGEPLLQQSIGSQTPVSGELLPVRVGDATLAVAVVAVDEAGSLLAERRLEAQVRFSELISKLSTRFVDIGPEDVLRQILAALEMIVEALGIDRSAVMQPAPEGDGMDVVQAYTAADAAAAPVPPRLFYADYPWITEHVLRGESISFSDILALDEAPVDRQTLLARGIVSGAVVPLKAGERIIGLITFVSLGERREWPPDTVAGLRLVGEIIANALDRKRDDEARQERLRFEQLLSRLSATFVSTPPQDVDVEIEEALGAVCVSFGFDRAVVSQMIGERFELTHEWRGPGVPSFRAHVPKLPIATVGWPIPELQQRKALVVHRDALPADAGWAREMFDRTELKTSTVIPLSVAGRGLGILSFHTTRASRQVPEDFLQRLRLVGEIVANTLSRQRTAESLRESEARFAQLLSSSLDGVAVLDAAGKVLEWSPQCERIFRSNKSEVLGKSLVDWLSGTAASTKLELERWLERSSRTGAGERLEVDTARSDGSALTLELTLSELSRSGSSSYACFFRDITDRRRVEAERSKAFEEISRLKGNLERERDYLREEVRERQRHEMVGQSTALGLALEVADAVAATNVTVLVRGESGVGKELFAHAIHAKSSRAQGPLVKVNCASIPKTLFESEFFGHVRGSFTGAHRDRIGRFELADHGTIFLDEVGEIPLPEQAKLLRVLQEGEFERVGDDRTRKVDVRVIAATNRDLERELAEGRFRRDLYYRLCAFPVVVPPLRERKEDIVAIASHFLASHSRGAGRESFELSARDIELLEAYDWPGNIRELEHVIERAVILSKRPPLRLDLALPGALRASPAPAHGDTPLKTDAELREFQRQNLIMALERSGWRIAGAGGAAELLGIRPSTLRDRMRAFGIARHE